MTHIHSRAPRGKNSRLINIDTDPRDLAKTLRRELGQLGLAHLARAIAELGDRKPTVLIASAEFDRVWRAR